MADWLNITCPACAEVTKVPNHQPILACGRCGTELVIRQMGDVISLAPVTEALNALTVEVSGPDNGSSTHAKAEILDLLSEIDQLWLERRYDLRVALRLMVIASCGLFLIVISDAGWLRGLAGLMALAYLPGLFGLYDYFIGKSKAAKRQRLEQALSAIWSTLDPTLAHFNRRIE